MQSDRALDTEHGSDARVLCSRCECEITSADAEHGACTNCGAALTEQVRERLTANDSL